MKSIYPGDTREALEVFCLYEGQGNFFDISNPSHVTRGTFAIGEEKTATGGYFVGEGCIGCGTCLSACPQQCVDISGIPAEIDQNRCLHCGRCMEICPVGAIEHR